MKINSNVRYIIGRGNLAITIFVPYDCPNHCPFCTSKNEYANGAEFSLTKILVALKKAADIPYITDIVITGGEPFADLRKLQRLLDACVRTRKKIYINTTLPVADAANRKELLEFIIKNKSVIDGLNISRHMCLTTNLEDDSLIASINDLTKIKLRINSVLLGIKAEETEIIKFIRQYAPRVHSISFRGDYTKITDQNTLRGLDHPILNVLFNLADMHYLGSGGCLVCNNDDFDLHNVRISLHRGYEHSLVIKGANYIVNDIIIKQNGKICIDWDGRQADIKEITEQWSQ